VSNAGGVDGPGLESTVAPEIVSAATAGASDEGMAVEAEVVSAAALFTLLRERVTLLPIRPETAAILTDVIFGDPSADQVDRAAARLTRREP
jgi:hypothetical protein